MKKAYVNGLASEYYEKSVYGNYAEYVDRFADLSW